MAVVLVAVAVSAFVTRGRDGGAGEPASASAVVGERTAQVILEPGRASGAVLHVYLTSPRGALDTGRDITVVATRPDGGDPVVLEAIPAGPNHAINPEVTLPAAGTWKIEVTARYGGDAGGDGGGAGADGETVRWEMTLDVEG